MSRQIQIKAALDQVRSEMSSGVELIVVTKTFPLSDLETLYSFGERHFGENRQSELSQKAATLERDINWHFQGGLQSNKLRAIVSASTYIHSLDQLHHAAKISEIAVELKKRQRCFIQINLDSVESRVESSKRSGIDPSELSAFTQRALELPGLVIVGVMGVAPLNTDPRPCFASLNQMSQEILKIAPNARFISAGMSGDYQIAMEYGATHIRVGSSILGLR